MIFNSSPNVDVENRYLGNFLILGSIDRAIIWDEYDPSVDDRVLTFDSMKLISTLLVAGISKYIMQKKIRFQPWTDQKT